MTRREIHLIKLSLRDIAILIQTLSFANISEIGLLFNVQLETIGAQSQIGVFPRWNLTINKWPRIPDIFLLVLSGPSCLSNFLVPTLIYLIFPWFIFILRGILSNALIHIMYLLSIFHLFHAVFDHSLRAKTLVFQISQMNIFYVFPLILGSQKVHILYIKFKNRFRLNY